MAVNTTAYYQIVTKLNTFGTTLVAVSKTKPVQDILQLYQLGQKDFGENYVQELVDKQIQLPKDIHWHFIGHLQKNKVKYIASFVYLIHGVDSLSLLTEINKQAQKYNRVIDCLLQVYIAHEITKFGLSESELYDLLDTLTLNSEKFKYINIRGLMGMASFSNDAIQIKHEFEHLKQLFDTCKIQYPVLGQFNILSMGMSGDYEIALSCSSNMVRIGSLLFGERQK
ncbi:MAG: YggS family pyridoxal phosphate-dependent enzyme [Bacteroidota bacterium]|jgi:pyridoxal phosphate enzyme (YggS family)|nr:YggS family pyridoxal phosphate-dependent enzyme [Bacteroidota bacterium]